MELILASGSPRRQQMLKDLGVSFRVQTPDINESRLRGEPALNYVLRLAQEKAESVATKLGFMSNNQQDGWAILAADTIVVYGKLVLGKPTSKEDAVKMLRKLSGRTHEVITGYCWLGAQAEKYKSAVTHVRTKVTFMDMPDEFWSWYVSTGEPMDKAGSYAAQGIGISFIEKVSGSYSNVIGLPLPQVLKTYAKLFGTELHGHSRKSR